MNTRHNRNMQTTFACSIPQERASATSVCGKSSALITTAPFWPWQGHKRNSLRNSAWPGGHCPRRVVASHRRALAIDDPKICRKPLFASLGVSSYFFKGGIEIRMRGEKKSTSGKESPPPVAFRKASLLEQCVGLRRAAGLASVADG